MLASAWSHVRMLRSLRATRPRAHTHTHQACINTRRGVHTHTHRTHTDRWAGALAFGHLGFDHHGPEPCSSPCQPRACAAEKAPGKSVYTASNSGMRFLGITRSSSSGSLSNVHVACSWAAAVLCAHG
eukprot:8221714-Alexandrium_andersonii.AAC.1